MKKILFFIPFFLWSCGGSPTEPNNPPDVISIQSVVLNNNIVSVLWSQSSDNNFQKYTLLTSYTSDLSSPSILYETQDQYSNSFSFDISNEWGNYPKYFALRVTNKNGLSSTSSIMSEDSLHNLNLPLTEFGNNYSGSIYQIEKTLDNGFVGADRNRFYKIINNGLEYSRNFGSSFSGSSSGREETLYNVLILSTGEILAVVFVFFFAIFSDTTSCWYFANASS